MYYLTFGVFYTFAQIPDLKDPEAVQRFFLQEVQLGEEMLASGCRKYLYNNFMIISQFSQEVHSALLGCGSIAVSSYHILRVVASRAVPDTGMLEYPAIFETSRIWHSIIHYKMNVCYFITRVVCLTSIFFITSYFS